MGATKQALLNEVDSRPQRQCRYCVDMFEPRDPDDDPDSGDICPACLDALTKED